jgi:putative toxin-antitoxin system antitoxin component (TIGR02293 family)
MINCYSEANLLGIPNQKIGEQIKKGLPIRTVEHLEKSAGITTVEMMGILDVSDRNWRRRKNVGALNLDESNTVFRTARVFSTVLGMTHGDTEKAKRWMRTPRKALGGKTPITCLVTDADSQEVIDLVGRIREGISS